MTNQNENCSHLCTLWRINKSALCRSESDVNEERTENERANTNTEIQNIFIRSFVAICTFLFVALNRQQYERLDCTIVIVKTAVNAGKICLYARNFAARIHPTIRIDFYRFAAYFLDVSPLRPFAPTAVLSARTIDFSETHADGYIWGQIFCNRFPLFRPNGVARFRELI